MLFFFRPLGDVPRARGDVKISQLPVATVATLADSLIINQAGVTKQITVQNFLASFGLP